MTVKAVEMVHKIRDQLNSETKGLSVAEEIKFIRKKAEKLEKKLNQRRSIAGTHLADSSR